MKTVTYRLKLGTFVVLAGVCVAVAGGQASGRRERTENDGRAGPAVPVEPFSPSNARTADGKLIPAGQFFPASRCAVCHQDTHRFWSESLHRNAAREPFYRESADILLRTRGIEFTRHCESCHTPVALFSGALSKESGKTSPPFTPHLSNQRPYMSKFTIKAATIDDVPLILTFIKKLAEYEKLAHMVTATEEGLREALFGARQYAEIIIALRWSRFDGQRQVPAHQR